MFLAVSIVQPTPTEVECASTPDSSLIERRLLDLMYLDGRASHSRVQRFYNVVHASHKLLREYAVAEICSGSFNDPIIDSLYTRKLTSTITDEDMRSIINPIAHGMSSGHSAMGEDSSAMSLPPIALDSSAMSLPPIVLTSSPISLSDVVQLSKQTYGLLETYDAQLDAMYGSQAYDDAVYGPEPAHEAAFAFKVSREGHAAPIIQTDVPQAFLQAEIDVPQYR